jgi:hypothetical protein
MYSIFKNSDGFWSLGLVDNPKTIWRFKTQKEAINASRSLADKGETIIVHYQNGTVRRVLGLKNKNNMRTVKTHSKLDIEKINIAIASTIKNKTHSE